MIEAGKTAIVATPWSLVAPARETEAKLYSTSEAGGRTDAIASVASESGGAYRHGLVLQAGKMSHYGAFVCRVIRLLVELSWFSSSISYCIGAGGRDVKYLLFMVVFFFVGHCRAQQVYKCIKGKEVSYQSQPCPDTRKAAKQWDATPEPPPSYAGMTRSQDN